MITVLATGQSNMIGFGLGGPLSSVCSSNVSVWNNGCNLGANGDAWIAPALGKAPFNSDGSNNLALWFCDRLARWTGDTVRLVLVAQNGAAISQWAVGQPVYNEINDVMTAANSGPADILLWQQGEAAPDANGTVEAYKAAWLGVRNQLVRDGRLAPNAISVVGGTYRPITDQALQELAEEHETVAYATRHNLEASDGIHYSGNALARLGAMFFSAYVQEGTGWPQNAGAVIASEIYPSQTMGGSSQTGGYARRMLTVMTASVDGSSLNQGVVTLPAGTWHIEASAPAVRSNRMQVRLVHGATGDELAVGLSEYAAAADTSQGRSFVHAVLALDTPTPIALEQYTQTGLAMNGLGMSGGGGADSVFAGLAAIRMPSP